jgi:hypothetical protein
VLAVKRFFLIAALLILVSLPAAVAAQPAPATQAPSGVCVVVFKGRVTQLVNPDERLSVEVGDKLVGSLTYDPDVVSGTVNPGPPGGPFPVHPLVSLSFSVGSLSATLDPALGGFIVPALLGSEVNSVGAFFVTADSVTLRGGNTINMGGGTFVIGNSSDGGILGEVKFGQPKCSS